MTKDKIVYRPFFSRDLLDIDELDKDFEKEIDNIFRMFGNNFVFRTKDSKDDRYRSPIAYMKETDKEYSMNVEIPGVKKEEIKLNLKGGGLELIAESKSEKEGEKSYSKFYFYRTLPKNIDQKNITSEYKEGILEVKLPKLAYESPEKLEIKIN